MLELIADIARIIQGTVSVILLTGVFIAYLSWRSKQNLDRRAAALSFSLTRNKDYAEAENAFGIRFREFLSEKKPASVEQVAEIISQEKEIATKIKYLLAHWEIMAISILDDLVDEKVCFEMAGSTFVTSIEVLEPYIMDIRKNRLKRRTYDYLLILNKEWKNRIEKMERLGTISRFEQYENNGNNIGKLRRRLQSNLKEW